MSGAIDLPPYAAMLGITASVHGDGPVLAMAASDMLLGRPGFLHGGTLAALLEFTAVATVRHAAADPDVQVALVGMTVDFLRGARGVPTRASGRIIRLGRRIAAVEVAAVQDDPDRPVATARLNLSLDRG